MTTTSPATPWIKTGLAMLPLYGVLVGYATLRPQPDQAVDPDGWARFVGSPSYLAEHSASNVLGALFAIFGTLALGGLLATTRASRLALPGTVLAVAGHILFLVPGTLSTFATPAIGTGYLNGNRDVMALEFSPLLAVITTVALLLAVVGNTLLGLAVWRSGVLPKWAGLIWIAGTLVFYVLGFALGMATTGASLPTQPGGAMVLTLGSGWIAWSVLRSRPAKGPNEVAVPTSSNEPVAR